MATQKRITSPCDLLDEKGILNSPGYATAPLWRYDRRRIKAGWHRIKEWDYYALLAPENGYGITLTLADLGYAGLAAVCWLDFQNKRFRQAEAVTLLPRGRTGLPPTSESGSTRFKNKGMTLDFQVSDRVRTLDFKADSFTDENGIKGISGKIKLVQPADMDTMVIATPWKHKPTAFYYNQKINCMAAQGEVTLGRHTYEFPPGKSYGTLDWGRGNWPYKNRWYWGSASGRLDGESFGWNIGYGFSDRSAASENMVFYKGKAHKLDKVVFHMNPKDYTAPWKITSNDHRFEMDFTPVLDRQSRFDFKLVKSVQHQVFGHFTGTVTLDDGKVLTVKNFFGFAEEVLNWW